MNKLIVIDSGSPNEGIPSTQYEVESPFVIISKPEEQDDIKNVRLFQIQIEKIYQTFAVGSISSIYDFELNELVQKSMSEEQERDDLENLRIQDEKCFDDFITNDDEFKPHERDCNLLTKNNSTCNCRRN